MHQARFKNSNIIVKNKEELLIFFPTKEIKVLAFCFLLAHKTEAREFVKVGQTEGNASKTNASFPPHFLSSSVNWMNFIHI